MKIGQKFGFWTVAENSDSREIQCVCSCGTRKLVRKIYLNQGRSKSCGCRGIHVGAVFKNCTAVESADLLESVA